MTTPSPPPYRAQKGQYVYIITISGCLIGILLLLALCATSPAIIVTTLRIVLPTNSHPTDDELVQLLSQNQAAFEEIADTTQNNHSIQNARIRNTWTDPVEILTKEQWDYYKKQFLALDIEAGVDVYRKEGKVDIYFNVSTSGLGISGSSKGIAYLNTLPSDLELVDNIDSSARSFRYRHIRDNWYLFGSSD